MKTILSIKHLDYESFFKDFNLDVEYGSFISIIGPNGSGKSMLTKILCAIYPTTDFCFLDGIALNKENVLDYLSKIGIASNDFSCPFLHKKVKQELKYPLKNLGYSAHSINETIKEISNFFQINDLLDMNIKDLTYSLKNKLLIVLALIHNPKVLVLDDIFQGMEKDDEIFILEKLKELQEKGLTIINITSKLDTIYDSNKVYVLNHFQIEKQGSVKDILTSDSYLTKIGLEIPFIVDLSLKLKSYDLIKKIYFDYDALGEKLWK